MDGGEPFVTPRFPMRLCDLTVRFLLLSKNKWAAQWIPLESAKERGAHSQEFHFMSFDHYGVIVKTDYFCRKLIIVILKPSLLLIILLMTITRIFF